ncbi:hypothetical protein [Flavobacterium lacus]|uniref:hypothetical protein n=1 Tax=Flavobacterium lacus TaxID=1353778 RepID=UPI0015EB58D6|nr:hypothetical protein [Flavobacterium lacus]
MYKTDSKKVLLNRTEIVAGKYTTTALFKHTLLPGVLLSTHSFKSELIRTLLWFL